MKHRKRLVRDEDYIVIEEHPAYRRSTDENDVRRSKSAIKVYAPSISDDEVYLCRECEQFTSPAVQGIHGHSSTHRRQERAEAGQSDSTALRSIAFGLLPEKMQVTLLTRARKMLGAP